MGVEPTSSAWKADVFAVRRHSHKGGLPAFASCCNSKEVNCYAPASAVNRRSLKAQGRSIYYFIPRKQIGYTPFFWYGVDDNARGVSEMCVGPTRGLAERGRPFFRHTLLGGGGVGGTRKPSCAQAPPTQPGGEVIALLHPAVLSNFCQE